MIDEKKISESRRNLLKLQEKIFDVFRYRAISLNLISKSTQKDYDISSLTKIHINLRVKSHRVTKKDFNLWVIGNCFTYMLESYQLYLDEILKKLYKKFNSKSLKKIIDKPTAKIEDKMTEIYEEIRVNYSSKLPFQELSKDEINSICSLRNLRNCIVHDHGKVSALRINKKTNTLELSYIYVRKSKKPKKLINNSLELYTKEFKLNTTIRITESELYRIGIFIYNCASKIMLNFEQLFDYPINDDDIVYKSGSVIIKKEIAY